MSWTRTKYDECAYNKELSQSTTPFQYLMDPNKFYNRHNCRPGFGILAGNNVSITRQNMVDLESELMGRTRKLSLCPEHHYIPHCSKCSEICGLKSTNQSCSYIDSLQHLPECQIIEPVPRIDHVGFTIKYPKCYSSSKPSPLYFKNPPQLNPTQFNF